MKVSRGHRFAFALFGFLAAGPILGACAFGDRAVVLEPKAVEVQPSVAGESRVVLLSFSDIRRDKNKVGAVRNGHGTETAGVMTQSDVVRWVRESLISSLEKGGFKVRPAGGASSDVAGATGVSVRLYRVHSDVTYLGVITGEVQALFAAARNANSRNTVRQTIEGVGKSETAFAEGSAYQRALELALADFVRNSVVWIDRVSGTSSPGQPMTRQSAH